MRHCYLQRPTQTIHFMNTHTHTRVYHSSLYYKLTANETWKFFLNICTQSQFNSYIISVFRLKRAQGGGGSSERAGQQNILKPLVRPERQKKWVNECVYCCLYEPSVFVYCLWSFSFHPLSHLIYCQACKRKTKIARTGHIKWKKEELC